MNAEPQTEPITFRIESELVDELRRLAKENERTLSGELRLAIRDHVAAARSFRRLTSKPPPPEPKVRLKGDS